jgi:TorA maturation chaperone TorD
MKGSDMVSSTAVHPQDKLDHPRAPEPSGSDLEQRWRAHTYRLLGVLLGAPPKAAELGALQAIQVGEADRNTPMGPVWEGLRMAAAMSDVRRLDDEYHDLFIGIGRGELVPYGSWYLTGLLMDQPLAVLRATLAELGFERQDGVCEPEDHAAALCETMAMIIENSDEIGFERQRTFFDSHMAPWLGRFFADLKGARSARFYRAVGELGDRFMRTEQQYFSMLV